MLHYVQMVSIREYIIAAAVYWNQSIYYRCCCRVLEYYLTDDCGVMCSLLEPEHLLSLLLLGMVLPHWNVVPLCYVQFIGIRAFGKLRY